jgi:hypothetical protein
MQFFFFPSYFRLSVHTQSIYEQQQNKKNTTRQEEINYCLMNMEIKTTFHLKNRIVKISPLSLLQKNNKNKNMRKRVNNIKESDQYETAFMTKKRHKNKY